MNLLTSLTDFDAAINRVEHGLDLDEHKKKDLITLAETKDITQLCVIMRLTRHNLTGFKYIGTWRQ